LVTDAEGNVELGCFVRVGTTLEQDRSMVAYYADAGLTLFEPLPGREMDVLGIGVSYTRFGDDFRSSASGEGVAASETALEFLYRAQTTRWLALTADLQFLFNPAVNPESGSRETATVLGLRAEIEF
jgi:carbohydrate-selective porin OprB